MTSGNDEYRPSRQWNWQCRHLGDMVSGRCWCRRILTGRWAADRSLRATHHGALQFALLPDGTAMRGRWVGFDRNNHIQTSSWEWTLHSPSIRQVNAETVLAAASGEQS